MKRFLLIPLLIVFGYFLTGCAEGRPKAEQEGEKTGSQTQTSESETTVQSPKEELITIEDLQNKVQTVYNAAHTAIANITTTVVTPGIFSMSIPQQGTGSGFLWDNNGHVVTNYHVVKNAKSITVSLEDNEMLEAEMIGNDPFTDLAVLKIKTDNLPEPLSLDNSDQLDVGQFVVALGNPFSFDQTLTFGVISALGRVIQSSGGGFISEAIQTDTPINPGNSGGPLLNMNGNVIGVNSAIISPSGASAGIGFAISSNTVAKVVPALIEDGHFPHPWLGFQSLNLTERFGQLLEEADLSVPVNEGILIVNVFSGTPADNAGLQGGDQQLQIGNMKLPVGGDIIVSIDGEEITTYKEMVIYLENETGIGDTIEVTIYRDGSKMQKEVKVGERPQDFKISP